MNRAIIHYSHDHTVNDMLNKELGKENLHICKGLSLRPVKCHVTLSYLFSFGDLTFT